MTTFTIRFCFGRYHLKCGCILDNATYRAVVVWTTSFIVWLCFGRYHLEYGCILDDIIYRVAQIWTTQFFVLLRVWTTHLFMRLCFLHEKVKCVIKCVLDDNIDLKFVFWTTFVVRLYCSMTQFIVRLCFGRRLSSREWQFDDIIRQRISPSKLAKSPVDSNVEISWCGRFPAYLYQGKRQYHRVGATWECHKILIIWINGFSDGVARISQNNNYHISQL